MHGDQYFQGDLMFIEVEQIGLGDVMNAATSGKIVLARGEKTGHEHVLDLDQYKAVTGRLWDGNQVILVGENGATVVHTGDSDPKQLHGPLALPANKAFVVRQQRSWTRKEPVKVVD